MTGADPLRCDGCSNAACHRHGCQARPHAPRERRALLAGLLLLGLGSCVPGVPDAAPAAPGAALPCAPAVELGRSLAERFGERPAGAGLHDSDDGRGWVLMMGPRSWSALERRGDGSACLVGWGVPIGAAEAGPES